MCVQGIPKSILVCLVLNPIHLTKGLENPLVWNSCGRALCPGAFGRFSAPLLRGRLAHTLRLIWVQRGISCPKADMLISEKCQPSCLKLLTVHTSWSCLLLCFLPSLSLHRSGQSQTWRKFPLHPCVRRLVPAICLARVLQLMCSPKSLLYCSEMRWLILRCFQSGWATRGLTV